MNNSLSYNNSDNTKSAFISIIGRPNVGKSSIMNQLIGQKVSIVSSKPQTTRNRIMGILTVEDTQLVFLDTPGAHRPRNRLGDYMVKTITEAISGVDAAVLVVTMDKRGFGETEEALLKDCQRHKLPVILAINKIDLVKNKEDLLEFIENVSSKFNFEAIVPVSALKGNGLDGLLEEIKKFTFKSPHFFAADSITDQPEMLLASEIVREKILRHLNDEIPHGIAVVIERFKERSTPNGDIIDIEANIFCERESHKGIVIGKKGDMLKRIGSSARGDLERIFGTKVNLQCWVKVKEDWRNRQGLITSFGYRSE